MRHILVPFMKQEILVRFILLKCYNRVAVNRSEMYDIDSSMSHQ